MSAPDDDDLVPPPRLSGSADTILLTATRSADLETPIGAFMRFDDGGPAFLLPRAKLEEDLGPRLVQLVKKIDADLGRD